MPKTLSRRTMLRGAGGVALGLPFLDAMRTKTAMAQSFTRYIQLSTPLGMSPGLWYTGSPSAISIADFAAPLRPHVNDLLIVRGLRGENGGDGHDTGQGWTFTGALVDSGYGISVDQEIAKINKGGRFPSLQFGFFTSTDTSLPGQTHTVFAGPKQPINSNNDPRSMFTTLFGAGGAGGSPVLDAALARKRSVLDLVKGDFDDVKVGLSTADKQRLTDHAEFLRSIETSLTQIMPAIPTCNGGDPAKYAVTLSDTQGDLISRAQIDLLVMAAACDLTRVSSLQWSYSVNGLLYKWLDKVQAGTSKMSHHQWTHNPDTGNVSVGLPYFHAIEQFYLREVGYLLGELKRVGAFDNAILVWGTSEARGPHMDIDEKRAGGADHVYVIAQPNGGYFKTGGRVADLYLSDGADVAKRWDYRAPVLWQIAKAFGYQGAPFGPAGYYVRHTGGPAPGLTT